MKVLDLTTLYIDGGEGGVNTYLREKARCLGAMGIQHTVVVPGRETAKARCGSSSFYRLKSPQLLGNGQHRVLVDFPKIAGILHEEKPDVVEVDSSYLLGYVAARALRHRKVPIVGFYHVHLPMLYARPVRSRVRQELSGRTEPFVWNYTRFCTMPCDRVVVTTRDMYRRMEGRNLPRLELVPLGVNLDLFRPRNTGRKPAIDGIDPRKPVVLYVGRLSREKELDVLFQAHERLQGKCQSQLVIAGDGPLRRQARRFAKSMPGVVYLGMCAYGEKLAQLYWSADVLAVPGRNETFSLIVLEAFASGIPVVAADQGGPAELLRPDVGGLARPGDADDFATNISAVLNARIQSSVCRHHVETSYSWERTFSRLLEVYESLGEKAAEIEEPRLAV